MQQLHRTAIADLVHRYADASTHADAERWAGTWAPDATWELVAGQPVLGRESIVEAWQAAMERFTAVVQLVMNGSVDPDARTGRWYLTEHLAHADGARSLMVGHYDDTYTETGSGWCFTRRALTVHYLGPPDLSGTFFDRRHQQ
jgi:uncharacterized protein (TIGR02246 family)